MRQGVWRLPGTFPIAHLRHSSRLFSSSCTSFLFATHAAERRHGVFKTENGGKVLLPLDHNERPLFQYGLGADGNTPPIAYTTETETAASRRHSKANDKGKAGKLLDHKGQPLSEEAIVVAREYWRLRRLLRSSPIFPSHNLTHEIRLQRAAYNHIVLNLNRAPGAPVTLEHEPPNIDPSEDKHEALTNEWKQSTWEAEELPALSPEQERVVKLAEKRHNIFFTGSAGSGKSRVLKAIVKRLKSRGLKVQVAAPTGKAAFNVNGMTTWSYAGWSPGLTGQSIKDLVFQSAYTEAARKRIKKTDVLIIDEISMVENHHFERLNMVHKEIRQNSSPFGGIQVIVMGDFCQLPPVLPFKVCYKCGKQMERVQHQDEEKTTYTCKPCRKTSTDADKWAFRSNAWKECKFENVHLNEIHRQREPEFISILQKCRVGAHLTDQDIDSLINHPSHTDKATKLLSTRWEVRRVNQEQFYKLEGRPQVFKCIDRFHWHRELHPELEYLGERNPQDGTLRALREHVLDPEVYLKVGMPVVLYRNLDVANGLTNGSQGVVIGFRKVPFASRFADRVLNTNINNQTDPLVLSVLRDEFLRRVPGQMCPLVEFPNNVTKVIEPITREIEYGSTPPHTMLMRTQLPLGPAWAMTIHRSQGLTMDRVVVDLSKAFAMGQSYVGLSRARSLQGLKVEGDPEILRTGMELDQAVKDFMDETFGDVWMGGVSVSGTSSKSPMQQAIDESKPAPAEAEAGAAS